MRRNTKGRDDLGVSPVIVTILMVLITVVLAAVLYVVVMGFADEETQPRTPKQYYCDGCGWTGALADCNTALVPEMTMEYNLALEEYMPVTKYYTYYYCPDCGEFILRVFLYQA